MTDVSPILPAPPSRLTRIRSHASRVAKHRMAIGLCSAVVVAGGVAWVKMHPQAAPVRYVLAAVTRGTLVTSVSGSGQVSDQRKLELKPPVSARVVAVNVKPGQPVKTGDVLVELDAKDAQKAVRDASQSVHDAQLSLQSAQLSLQKLSKTDPLGLQQKQDALAQAERALADVRKGADAEEIRQAEQDLAIKEDAAKLSEDGVTPQIVRTAIDGAVSDVKAAALEFRDALNDADEILGIDGPSANDTYEKLLSVMNSALLPTAESLYAASKEPVLVFKRQADLLPAAGAKEADVEAIAAQGAAAADGLRTMLENVQDVLANTITSTAFSQGSLDVLKSAVASDRSAVNTQRDRLIAARDAADDARATYASARLAADKARAALDDLRDGADANDVAAAEERVIEARLALEEFNKGPDALDVASAQNSVAQRRSSLVSAANRLKDAKETLAEYTVRTPFDATVGDVTATPGDQASAGTALLTLFTKNGRIAEITMNEVDATNIKPGQKATLTFDAIPDLTIAGTVSQIDGEGTVSQGVVSYGVTIAFETNDERIKPGMSVSANIVTLAKTDVLLVPSSAIQTAANGLALAQTLPGASGDDAVSPAGVTSDEAPQALPVQTGASNDQETEITDGLNEGDLVIVRTIQPVMASTQRTTGSFPGLGGGNATRIQGGGGNFRGAAGGQAVFISR